MSLTKLKEIQVGRKFAFLYANTILFYTALFSLFFYILAVQYTSVPFYMGGITSLGLGVGISIAVYRTNTKQYRKKKELDAPPPPDYMENMKEDMVALLEEIKQLKEEKIEREAEKKTEPKKKKKKEVERIAELTEKTKDRLPKEDPDAELEEDDLEDSSLGG